jgi:tRNA modification GTPase
VATAADTIAAVASGAGRAGIGVIRVSGPDVPAIAKKITGQTLQPRYAHYLKFLNASGEALDIGIALLFDAPHSYTGEHVLELQGHGGPVVMDQLLEQVLFHGARAARPGEFTERAFLNDKLDLAQAEAVADLINANTKAASQAAVRSMGGALSVAVDKALEELIALRVWLEAALDFSEEEIDFLAEPELQHRTKALESLFADLINTAQQGQRLRDGLTIVIAGSTNVGKSSLLNVLSGADSAIVTDIAGTTRDVLHEHISIEGMPLHIIDTAGLRKTDDAVEQQGIERARQAASSADHILLMIDASDPKLPDIQLPGGVSQTVVLNKIDLSDNPVLPHGLPTVDLAVSVKTGEGIAELKSHLLKVAGRDESVEGVFIARRRHLDALQTARDACSNALNRLQENTMPELAAEDLKLAQQALGEITGKFDTEDLLGRIFADFCVGK